MFDTVKFKKLFNLHFNSIGFVSDFYSEHSPIEYMSVISFANSLNYNETLAFSDLLNINDKNFEEEIFDKFSDILKKYGLESSELCHSLQIIEKSIQQRRNFYALGLSEVTNYVKILFDKYPARISHVYIDKMNSEVRLKINQVIGNLPEQEKTRAILSYCENKFTREHSIQIADFLKNLPFGSTQDYFSYSDKSQVPKCFNSYILDMLDIKDNAI